MKFGFVLMFIGLLMLLVALPYPTNYILVGAIMSVLGLTIAMFDYLG